MASAFKLLRHRKLNHLSQLRLNCNERVPVADEVARFLEAQPHVARVLTRAEIEQPPAANDPDLLIRARKSYYAPRCGDLFLALAPWTFPDPGDADEALSLEQRRATLAELGAQLAAGSGHARENSQAEHVVWADIQVSKAPVP